MAAEVGIAPGTVARAYAVLEKKGIVATEGARGTRVAPPPSASSPVEERVAGVEGLIRPVVISSYHLGAKPSDLRTALERAMAGVYEEVKGGK